MASTPYPINLVQGINTSTPDGDIRPFAGAAEHLADTGIERDGGIVGAYEVTAAKDAASYVQYTKSGKQVKCLISGATQSIYVDGVQIAPAAGPLYGVQYRKKLPKTFYDCVAGTEPHTVYLLVKTNATTLTIEEWLYTVATDSWAQVTGSARTFSITVAQYVGFKIVRTPTAPSYPSDITHIACQIASSTYPAILKYDGTTVFYVATATPYTELFSYMADTYFFLCDMIANNSWTYETGASALVAYSGYGYPYLNRTVHPTLYIYRVPTTSDVIGKAINTITGAADILLTAAPTEIYYYKIINGSVMVSYNSAGGVKTETVRPGTIAATLVNTTRSYPTEIIGSYDNPGRVSVFSINGVAGYIGFAQIDNSSFTATMGQCISEVGNFDPTYYPDFSPIGTQQQIVYKTGTGDWNLVFIGQTIDNKLQLIGNEIVLLNAIYGPCIIDAAAMSLTHGPNAYNGALWVAVPAASPGAALTIAARNVGAYGGGIDTGLHILSGVGTLAAGRYYPPWANDLISGFPIDIYENQDYYGTATVVGIGTQSIGIMLDQTLVGTLYVEAQEIPSPMGSLYSRTLISLDKTTAVRNGIRAGYNLGNSIEVNDDNFELFGNLYIYDGSWIYQVNIDSGRNIRGYDPIALAAGLRYLVSTPTEVWFLSPWDNSLWTFNGGRNVEKKIRLNAKAAVTASAYNVASNELALLLDSTNVLYIRDGISSQNTLSATGTGTKVLQATNQGIWLIVQGGAGNMARLQYVSTGGTAFPLTFQTAYQGLELNARHVVRYYIFTLYALAKPATTVTLTFNAFDESHQYTAETQTTTIAWDASGYARVKFVPQNGNCIASSIKVYTTQHLAILDGYVYVEPVAGEAMGQS